LRANMWSRVLVVLSLFSFTVQAEPPETGTRVALTLAETSGQLPEGEKLIESLKAAGGEHQVRVIRRKESGQQELTMDLWGNFMPQAEIPQALRDAFPVLSSADIQVSTLEVKDRPRPREACDLERGAPGEKGTVKKVVKILKKE
jgi:hypothetical protein